LKDDSRAENAHVFQDLLAPEQPSGRAMANVVDAATLQRALK
jgi:hypothetical protein